MASAIIGALRANLTLNTAQFDAGARRARKTLDNLGVSMAGLRNAAIALKGTLAGLAAVSMRNAREVQTFARMMGTSAEELQKWAYAAKTVGVEQEQLGDMFKDFQEKVGEYMASGGGGMKDFFEQVAPKIGVTAQQFANLSGPQALQLYVKKMEEAGYSQRQMSFYLESMGSEMTRLIPLLSNGGGGLERLKKQAEETGAILSTAHIAELAALQNSFDAMLASFGGFAGRITAIAAPAFTALFDGLSGLLAPGGTINTIFETLASNLERLGHYAFVAVTGFAAYKAVVIGSAVVTAGLSAALGFLRVALMRTGIGLAIVAVGELTYRFTQLSEKTGSTAEAARLMGRVFLAVLNGMVSAAVHATNRVMAVFGALYSGIIAIFQNLPAALGAIFRASAATMAEGAANFISKNVNSLLIDPINSQLGKIDPRLGLTRQVEFDLGASAAVAEAKQVLASAGTEIADAAKAAFGNNAIPEIKLFDVGSISEEWGAMKKVLQTGGTVARETAEDFKHLNDTVYQEPPKDGAGGGAGGGTPKAARAAAAIADASNEQADALKRLREEHAHYQATLRMTAKEENVYRALQETGAANNAQLAGEVRRLVEETDAFKESQDRLRTVVSDLEQGFSDLWEGVLLGSKSAKEAVADLARHVAKMLAQSAFQQLWGGMGLGQAVGGLFGMVGKNANGTPNWRGGLTWVGERGPELVNLPRGSSVMDAQRSARMLDGGGTGRVLLELSPDLVGRILEQGKSQAIQITKAGLGQFERDVLPRKQFAVAQDARRRG